MINIRLSKFYFVVICISLGIMAQFISLISPSVLKAESGDSYWSWTSVKPTVFASNKVNNVGSGICLSYYETKIIDGDSTSRKVCMMKGENVSFGIYYAGSGSTFYPAVSFGYDNKMYKVSGICGQYDNCLYLPDTDTLVTKQYLINGLVRSFVLYKNFTQRLTPVMKGVVPSLSYVFDDSNPDYIFKNAAGYAWPIGGFGASKNGKWLAIEFRSRGTGLLNIETLQMKRVSTTVLSYGRGYDPTTELTVSNDGRHVALMGMNSGFSVFDVDSSCGDEATDAKMSSVVPITVPCKKANITSADYIYRLYTASNPKFSDDGGELNFFATSYLGEMREVSLRAGGIASQRLDYLALGDSFSSGEGETDDSFYLSGTNDNYEKCHLSARSYPFLISNYYNFDPNNAKSVACSGATTTDIVGADLSYLGQGDRFGERYMNFSENDRLLAQTWAKTSFLPGRIHQESFVYKYSPGAITVGIGGNDAGFMQKLVACLGPDTCDWAGTAKGREQVAVEIKSLYNTLVQTYQTLHIASPNSKIYAIGYPNIIDPTGDCNLLIGFLLNDSERLFMSQGINYLNQVISAAAGAAGIKYVDIQSSYGGHTICGDESPNAMNTIRLGDDINPINSIEWLKLIGQESFHPNSLGHAFAAESIIGSVGNLLTYDYCGGGIIICPNGSLAPEPSTYWVQGSYHNYPAQKVTSYVFDRADETDNRQKELVLSSKSLKPGSSVDVVITSEPVTIGQFVVGIDGSLDVDVDLPIDLAEGYHTIHLLGTSYSGELVELYQIIKYEKPYVAPVIEPVEEEPEITETPEVIETPEVVEMPEAPDITEIAETAKESEIKAPELAKTIETPEKAETPELTKPIIDQNLNLTEYADYSIAVADKPMVLGSSIVADKPALLTTMNESITDKNTSNFTLIAAICMVALTLAVFIIRRYKNIK